MNDLFEFLFRQIPSLRTIRTINAPNIIEDIANETVGSIIQGVFGELNVDVNGQHVGIHDSLVGNYQIETDNGVLTAMDRSGEGETFYEFDHAKAYSQSGLFGQENFFDADTHQLIGQSSMDALGQTTITVPSSFDLDFMNTIEAFDTFSSAQDFSDLADLSDFLDNSDTFLDLLDLF